MKSVFLFIRNNKWITAAIFSLLLYFIFQAFPFFGEFVYSRFLFLGFRFLWDYTIGWLPIPLAYLFLIISPFGFVAMYRSRKIWMVWSFAFWLKKILSFSSCVLVLFLWSWGFNYTRYPLKKSLQIQFPTPNQDVLEAEICWANTQIVETWEREKDRNSESDLQLNSQPQQSSWLSEHAAGQMKSGLKSLGFPFAGKPHARVLFPDGILYRLSCSGIYIPFFGEAYVEAALDVSELPFTYFHELAHACGFANEADANFIAWEVCMKSDYYPLRRSALFEYLEYLRFDLKRVSPKIQIKAFVDDEVYSVLVKRKEIRAQFPPWFPDFQSAFYDVYLQAMGVEGGIKSYSHMVGMVMAWKQTNDYPWPQ